MANFSTQHRFPASGSTRRGEKVYTLIRKTESILCTLGRQNDELGSNSRNISKGGNLGAAQGNPTLGPTPEGGESG